MIEIAAHAGTQFDPDLAGQFVRIMDQPAAAKEICGSVAEFDSGQPFLSDQQFQLLKKNLNYKF